MIEIDTIEKLNKIIKKDSRVIVVVFTTTWCTPCNLFISPLIIISVCKSFELKALTISIWVLYSISITIVFIMMM